MKEQHMFSFHFTEEGRDIECLTELVVDPDMDLGIDILIDKIMCPLRLIAMSHRMYDLTAGIIIKDKISGRDHLLTPIQIFELSLLPNVPLNILLNRMDLPSYTKGDV